MALRTIQPANAGFGVRQMVSHRIDRRQQFESSAIFSCCLEIGTEV